MTATWISATFADDGEARARALDVGRSFLVQAPAGSGKTELLIQRFLALLAHVERPERVVAMTFTRKAAGEMRDRILGALASARDSVEAETPHERLTQQLARDVLAQDERHGWHLTAHPARLAVQTIDAFCAGLARQAPLATGLGGASRFVERAQPLYEAAVREGLADADANDADWRRILEHFDNDAGAVVALTCRHARQARSVARDSCRGAGARPSARSSKRRSRARSKASWRRSPRRSRRILRARCNIFCATPCKTPAAHRARRRSRRG